MDLSTTLGPFLFASMLHRSVASIVLFFGAPLLFAGCGDGGGAAGSASGGTPTVIRGFVPDASDAGLPDEVPQAAAMAQTYQGSPLCHALITGCYPDDAINACDLAADAGASDADAAAENWAGPACHVVAAGSSPSTACFPAGLGLTNATCSRSTECAAGHECVGDGSCRHYCCGGNSACQINEFCDVQSTTQDPNTLVPVCMPEVPCLLLNDETCPASQQCTVVREDGSTSCVGVGTARDGDLCDAEHCARGLVCIGAQSAPRCAPLCYTTNHRACESTGRTCIGTLPLFPNPTIGVCQ